MKESIVVVIIQSLVLVSVYVMICLYGVVNVVQKLEWHGKIHTEDGKVCVRMKNAKYGLMLSLYQLELSRRRQFLVTDYTNNLSCIANPMNQDKHNRSMVRVRT